MITSKTLAAAVSVGLMAALATPPAMADSLSGVEGARMKERQGRHLNRQDREKLNRYGRNDDYGYRGGGYGYNYYDGPSVGIYIGPRRYYDPYGY